jgi:radical SAM protein (TIGR01212 family)
MDLSTSRDGTPAADWRGAGLRYYNLNFFYRWKFGGRVWKVSVDGKFGCPNVDGTLARGGCVFCDPTSFSPSRRLRIRPIGEQIDEGIRQVQHRHAVERFLAYFQPGTNTYAPVERLRTLYQQALEHPAVIGLIVGTRPDCLSTQALELLAELSSRKWVAIELGLQTIHDRTLDWMNRGHHYDAFVEAVEKVRRYGIPHIGAHVILGLPGEDRDEILATAREVARLGLDSIKLHNLYVVRNTPLARMVDQGEVRMLDRDEYVSLAVDFLEQLPLHCVVDRLSGDAPPQYLVGPMWCLDKQGLRKAVEDELIRRDSWQGRFHR